MNREPPPNSVTFLPPPRTLNIPFGQTWHVVTPRVYRYEDGKWIDEFFDTGRLRLSNFSQFASYADDIRGDKNEGHDVPYAETPDNKSLMLAHAQGMNSAVLCCSHRLDHALRRAFGRDSAFQILDTVGFALEISRQLPGFRGGYEGSCIYRGNRSMNRKIDFDIEKYKLQNGTMDMQMIPALSKALGGPELLFLKDRKYQDQMEYRLLWELDSLDGNFVDVVAPMARRFCRKVDPVEYGEEPAATSKTHRVKKARATS